MFFGRLFHLTCKNRYLRFRRTRNDRKTKCFLMLFVKIDENRCTGVQNRPGRPSAWPLTPVVRPSARSSAVRPPVRFPSAAVRPPVRPPGPGPATVFFFKTARPPVRLSARPSFRRSARPSGPGLATVFFAKVDEHRYTIVQSR